MVASVKLCLCGVKMVSKVLEEAKTVRHRGIEPRPHPWKGRILTIRPMALYLHFRPHSIPSSTVQHTHTHTHTHSHTHTLHNTPTHTYRHTTRFPTSTLTQHTHFYCSLHNTNTPQQLRSLARIAKVTSRTNHNDARYLQPHRMR